MQSISGKRDPYPEIAVTEPNPVYAKEILSNVGGKDSELSAISLYLYDHFVTQHHPELATAFLGISKTEMHHLDMFGKLAVLLGADPRFWEYKGAGGKKRKYWTPQYIRYAKKPRQIVSNALFSEYMAIEKYQRQHKTIQDPKIQAVLERIIQDEKEHVEILKGLLSRL